MPLGSSFPNRLQKIFRGKRHCSLVDVDFDELPQHHMTEILKAQDSYGTLDLNIEYPLTRTASTPGTRADINALWMSSSAAMSPLEKFYHKYIVQFDQREDASVSKRLKGKGKKKVKRKPSGDNTISSLDSLSCDDSHQPKIASAAHSGHLPREPAREPAQDRTDSTIRELNMETKCLLGKEWESSEVTRWSDPAHTYVRQEDAASAGMDLPLASHSAPAGDITREEGVTEPRASCASGVGEDRELHSCQKHFVTFFADSKLNIQVDPECIKITDKGEQLCVNGKPAQIIILGEFKVPPQGQTSCAAPRRKLSDPAGLQEPALFAPEAKRAPMHINGENVYINIGGENTQIKSYKDYGTVKITGRPAKKGSETDGKSVKKKKKTATKKAAKKKAAKHKAAGKKAGIKTLANKSEKLEGGEKGQYMLLSENFSGIEKCFLQGHVPTTSASLQVQCTETVPDPHGLALHADPVNPTAEELLSSTVDVLTTALITALRGDERYQCSQTGAPRHLPDPHCYVTDSNPTNCFASGEDLNSVIDAAGQLEDASSDAEVPLLLNDVPESDQFVSSDNLTTQAVDGRDGDKTSTPVQPNISEAEQPELNSAVSAVTTDRQSKDEDVIDETGLVDVYSLRREIVSKNHQLKKSISKFREKTDKIARLHNYMEQLKLETAEMRRLLAGVDRQTEALRCEAAEMRCTVTAICDLSVATIGKETEARRLEPACYRRYLNIRTAADATTALTAVRNRIKALSDLEVLIYRKQLVLHHVLPTLAQEKTQPQKQRVNRPSHKGAKSKKSDETSSSQTIGGGGHIVIEVVSPVVDITTPSWSDEVSHTESPLTISVPFSASNDGTVSTQMLPDTEV